MRITGIALNADFSICANGVITFRNILTDAGQVAAETNLQGEFEVVLDEAGQWAADKVVTSEIIIIE